MRFQNGVKAWVMMFILSIKLKLTNKKRKKNDFFNNQYKTFLPFT